MGGALRSAAMDRRSLVAVAVGGVVGAGLRWLIVDRIDDGLEPASWPWGVFLANVLGCLLLGVAVTAMAERPSSQLLGVTVGFCGALTTFSAFALDAALFLRGHEWGLLAGYVAMSFAAGVAAFTTGRIAGRRVGAST